MRFTDFQQVLFISGHTFIHVAPTHERLKAAVDDFQESIKALGSWSRYLNCFTNDHTKTTVGFRLGRFDGASHAHVQVLFMDGKKSEFSDPREYDESLSYPYDMDGLGPMTVR